MRQLARVMGLALTCAMVVLAATACGGKKSQTTPVPLNPIGAAEAASSPDSGGASTGDFLMRRLTKALEQALAARGVKGTMAAPAGEGNIIVDLNYHTGGLAGNYLSWHYRNLGDYNQDGIANIADVTPLAQHFAQTIADDPLVEVIDGDLDGMAGIGDVTALAEHFQSAVAAYVVESAAEEGGEYTQVGSVDFAEATGGAEGWKEFTFPLATDEPLWYRVVPVDAQGSRGLPSLPVQYRPPSPAPRVRSVSPRWGTQDEVVTFSAVVEGEAPFSYAWDFGAAAVPSVSTDERPAVCLAQPRGYLCYLTVSNAYGEHKFPFAVLVTPAVYPPFIEKLWPLTAIANTPTQFFAKVTGSEPLEWEWNFGGGATPNESGEASPTVLVGDTDGCECWIRVSNSAGVDSYGFVLGIIHPPVIESVWPTTVEADTLVKFSAQVSGMEPITWHWDFGGGAKPNECDEASPVVRTGEEGTYECSLTVSSGAGMDTFDFTLEATPRLGVWPMFGCDALQTRRSPYVGAQEPVLRWRYKTGGSVDSSPSIGADGTIYVGCSDNYLYALNSDGTLKWRYETGGDVYSSPAIAADGTVFVGSYDHNVYAINSDGTLNWSYETGDEVLSSPTLGSDGTIYIGSCDNNLYAFNPEGDLKWRYQALEDIRFSPAIWVDGTIYVGSRDGNLYAVNPDGSLKWRYGMGGSASGSPSIADDGTVYIGSNLGGDCRFYAINPDGTLKWYHAAGDSRVYASAIGADGAIYVIKDGVLRRFNPDGTFGQSLCSGNSSPSIGGDGTVYVRIYDGDLRAVGPDGIQKWSYHIGSYVTSSPTIGEDGTVYVGSSQYIYAFHHESPPTVNQVTPTNFINYSEAEFTVEVWGAEPLSYYWDFGGGATPNTSIEESPTVTIGSTGDYDASLTVNNLYGEYVYRFTLTSFEPILPGDWSMFGREPTHNRLSPYTGPQTATLKWRYQTGGEVSSSPAIAADGTVYVGSWDKYLYAISHDGTLRWRYSAGRFSISSPATGADGTVYVGIYGGLMAINSNGTYKWHSDYYIQSYSYSSPMIGADGTVYIGGYYGCVYAISPGGTRKWLYHEGGGDQYSSPAIGADGTVYIGIDYYLHAINSNGYQKWTYQIGWVDSSPAISADGTIYVGTYGSDYYYLYAINPDGTLGWRYETGGGIWSSPAIGADGTIYVGSKDGYLYAIDPEGTLKWRYETGGLYYSSPAIGADGTVYVGSYDNCIYAINPDGTLKWRYETGDDVFSSPAIAEDGTLYIGSDDGYLYAFHD